MEEPLCPDCTDNVAQWERVDADTIRCTVCQRIYRNRVSDIVPGRLDEPESQ